MSTITRTIAIKLTDGEWCVIQGLLTNEWNMVQLDDNRKAYADTLQAMRRAIIEATERGNMNEAWG